MIFDTLAYIGEKLNSEGILWAVGASVLLNHYGLVEKPNDIDILIDIKDIDRADEILCSLGEKKNRDRISTYSTRYFYEYIINNTDVDAMSGLIINYGNNVYKYIFDSSSITSVKEINGIDIPLTSLEDWYVLYQLIPGRENKVKMIEDYLKNNGVSNKELLVRALEGNLPYMAEERISKMLLNAMQPWEN